MKRKLKFLALLLTLVLSVSAFSGCFLIGALIDDAVNNPEGVMNIENEPTITYSYNEELKGYDVVVSGIVKNTSEHDWEWVGINLMLYDEEDNVLDSAYDSVDYLAANGTWRFCATAFTSYEPAYASGYTFTGMRADFYF